MYVYVGKLDEAAALGEEVVPQLRRHEGDSADITQMAMFHLGQTYTDQLRYAEAESLYLELIEIQDRELEPDHPKAMSVRLSLGWNFRLAGRYDEAERLSAAALADMRRVMGNDHPETLIAVNNLAIIYKDLERYDEAEPLYLENQDSGVRILGETHPENLPSMVNLASFYMSQERWGDAYQPGDRAVTTFTDIMPEGHVGIAFARMTRGLSLLEMGRFGEAERDLLVAEDFMSRVFPEDHRHLVNVREKLGVVERELEGQRWLSD